jgi:hypothetical protein
MRRLIAAFAGILAGCSSPLPPAGTQYDGDYVGQNTVIGGGGFLCGVPTETLTLVVRDGRFDYPFHLNLARTAPVPVQVAADGSFAGKMQYGTEDFTPRSLYKNAWVLIRGRIADGTLDGVVTDDRCVHRMTARRG